EIDNAGNTLFASDLLGPDVTSTNGTGLWKENGGNVELIARAGDEAPGANGGTFRTFINDLDIDYSVNSLGQVAFIAELDNADSNQDEGIWAQDVNGQLQLIILKGQMLEVSPGDLRTVASIDYRYGSNNGDGRQSGFSDRGEIVFRATFTDQTWGVFVSNAVAVPEPNSIIVLFPLLLLSHCLRGRKVRSSIVGEKVNCHRLLTRADSREG
ncbi:MAG: choice-of-anchor tandem repeat NxxGxxAF-containing protein, partial [Planctomycetota bacterium]